MKKTRKRHPDHLQQIYDLFTSAPPLEFMLVSTSWPMHPMLMDWISPLNCKFCANFNNVSEACEAFETLDNGVDSYYVLDQKREVLLCLL